MSTHRPTFRLNGAARGGGGATTVVMNRTGTHSRNRPLPPYQLSPAMRLIAKSRNIDQSGRAMVSLNQMNMSTLPGIQGSSPNRLKSYKDGLTKHENFEEFAARMMKTTEDDALNLGPEIHAALISMANGIDPMLGQERKRQLQRRFTERLDTGTGTNQDTEPHQQGQPEPETAGAIEIEGLESTVEGETPFVTTFGAGMGRTTLADMEAFQKRNRMWKSTLKSTLKYFQQSANSSKQPSEHDLQNRKKMVSGGGGARVIGEKKLDYGDNKMKESANKTKTKATADLDRILQRGSALMMASSALKPKPKPKPVQGQKQSDEQEKKPIEYSPPSTSFLEKAKDGILKLPIFDRIDSKRKNTLEQGFPFDAFEDDIFDAVKTAAREMKRSFDEVPGMNDRNKPFNGVKISSLVGNNAAKAQKFRQNKVIGEPDNMNPLQLKLVQGLDDAQLSSFLENHGRRNPEVGMQIIPGRAPDPGVQHSIKGHRRQMPMEKAHRTSEASPLEPKFRALPITVISRFGEDFGTVPKDDVTIPGPKKLSQFGNIRTSPFGVEASKMESKPKIHTNEGLKKLSFMDITKSQFIREMREHQSQFQQMKSKDEMRKSFPKTYVFPRLHKNQRSN